METVTNFFGITKPAETEQTLEAERRKCNEDIDARLQKLRDAAAPVDASADSKGPVIPSADNMDGGRRRTRRSTRRSTRRNKRSKKTKRRRSKRSGKRTRR